MKIFLLTLLLTASNCFALTEDGKISVNYSRNAYATTNVTTAAYVTIVAAMPLDANSVQIYDSSGQDLLLGIFDSTCTNKIQADVAIYPNMAARIPLIVSKRACVKLKAVSANATTGINLMTFFY